MAVLTRRRVLMMPLAGLLALLWVVGLGAVRAAASHTVPLTITITSVDGVGDDLDGDFRSDPDFYAGVEVGGGAMDDGNSFDTHVDDDNNVTPFWAITKNVTVADDSSPTTSLTLSVWDHDDCDDPFCTDTGVFESNDDQLDVKSGAGESATFTVNLNTGRWTGTVDWPSSCVTGDGGEAVKVCFDISVDSASGDKDGDFMLDGWERNGFNPDGDATVDVDLPAMGANVNRKDLFLELDCLRDTTAGNVHTHCPIPNAVRDVVQAFANATPANTDGSLGIQLHVDIGDVNGDPPGGDTRVLRAGAAAGGTTGSYGNYGGGGSRINEPGNTIIQNFDAAGAGTDFFTLKNANFDRRRDLVFRYAIFGHQTNARRAANDCTSGQAKGIPGVNFMVTLGGTRVGGGSCWGQDAAGFSVGSRSQQAGTLMHEFGHVLGLRHGGGDNLNNKPNYLSVMNYAISTGPAVIQAQTQACLVPAVGGLPGGCDYSRAPLATLNEVNPPGLDECAGIGLGLGGVDWDGAGGQTGASCGPPPTNNVSANVNNDFNDTNNNGTRDPGETNKLTPLPGFDDWSNIFYGFRTIPDFQTAGASVADEPDPESIAEARDYLAGLVKPVLSVDKTGPADAIPGDTLDYVLNVKNTGRGPALGAALTDTKPDASKVEFELGTIQAGNTAIRTASHEVACTVADGTVLTNGAAATATDLIGNPVSGSDSVQTTVHAPVLTLAKTATSSVNSGEAVTYRLSYANTGSGAATGAVVTDTLPADVYYSAALDTGSGPKPDDVTRNADGTTTLTWNVGTVNGGSGAQVIEYTARPSLLFVGGDSVANSARITFTNANGCTYSPVTASQTTSITEVAPSRDPLSQGFWKNHPELWTAELLARIQATDQRFDGADGSTPDGRLSAAEAAYVFGQGGTQAQQLTSQLLATYLNLASRRINASTDISSKTAAKYGLTDVRDAALFVRATLALPLNAGSAGRYSAGIQILEEINQNKSERY
ncbi:hypothetical protein AB0M28_38280 [Streptomyces sp. NPDC051940]|uniref:hypothetical protein n=1 Tax=Streptomyces sp. NPDC051940 TaxID=3155675 RepID=UPI003429F12E